MAKKICVFYASQCRKWHIGFSMTSKSSAMDDLEGHWQPVRSAVLDSWAFCYR